MTNNMVAKIDPLTVRLLGRFEVWRNGYPILEEEWERKKSRQLLGILLTEPGCVFSYDQLTDLLFSGTDLGRARRNLQSLASRLRRTLEPGRGQGVNSTFILSQREGYCFNTKAPYSLDTEALRDLVEQAIRLVKMQRWGDALDRCQRAVNLYVGDYAPDDLYEEWTLIPRKRCKGLYLRALGHLAECQAKTGSLNSAINTCQHIIEAEPWSETAYRQKMHAHYCAGEQGEAEETYRLCVEALSEHLDVEPSHETQQLHDQILHHEAPKLQKWCPNNLPHRLTHFIGRQHETAEIERLLGENRLVTLTGVGGTGKTRLALKVASDLLETFADGVWFVDLGAVCDGGNVPEAVAGALNVNPERGESPVDALRKHVQHRDMLLIIDTCEHLIDACAQLAETLLHGSPRLRALVTSREALRIEGEIAWSVPPLPTPPEATPSNEISNSHAVLLFLDRAEIVRPSFAPTSENVLLVAELCRKLEGLPLAIELAAANLKTTTLDDMIALLGDRFRLLAHGSRTAPARHQTLGAAMDWSYALLSDSERAVLRRLSTFAGGFTPEAATAVCEDAEIENSQVRDLLGSLVGKSLLVFDVTLGSGRFRLLDTLREYSKEKLQEAGEVDIYRRRHRDFYLQLAQRAETRGPAQHEWLDRLELELENLRAALTWSEASGEIGEGLRLAADSAMAVFWGRNRHTEEGLDWLQRLLDKSGTEANATVADGLSRLGALHNSLGHYGQAKATLERSVDMSRTLGEENCLATALRMLGNVENNLGNVDRAKAAYEESLTLERKLARHPGVAACLVNLGSLHSRHEHDYEAALRVLQEALSISRKIGHKHVEAGALTLLGSVYEQLGEGSRSKACYEESFRIAQVIGAKNLESWYWVERGTPGLGHQAFPEGNPDECRNYLELAVAIARESEDASLLFQAFLNQAMLLSSLNNYEAARQSLAQALPLARRSDCLFGPASLAGLLAEGLGEEGKPKLAMQLLGAAETADPGIQKREGHHFYMNLDRIKAPIRDLLGVQAAEAAFAEGQDMALDDLLAQLLVEE
ncbi:tetratricopeptide repeat protein [Candidatus Bipolaricaulota bacterium]